jgi:16S rRNA (cytosine967-C5)-methyltransferase
MKPESLLGITLELIEALAAPGALPADARVGRFFRERRYLGSRDRRLIGEGAYAWLRHGLRARARWDAWAAAHAAPASGALAAAHPRLAALAEVLALARDGLFPWSFEVTAAASPPPPPPPPGRGAGFWDPVVRWIAPDFLGEDAWPETPLERLAAEVSLPSWLAARLHAERGEEEARRLGLALLERAPVDLRVNLRLTTREAARRDLERELGRGLAVTPTPLSPLGLRLAGRANLTATRSSRKGWIEVADEGSQLIALSLDPAPGEVIIDACAGAGGKTLALADIVLRAHARGEGLLPAAALYGCDPLPEKLDELCRRARDGALEEWITPIRIETLGPLPPALPAAHLVLVDAPCSGLGTLRRNPELKLRYGPEDIAAFARTQREILERFAPLVRPGGRLAYSTCSLLAAENEGVARAFAGAHPEFEPLRSDWARARLPLPALDGDFIRLDPLRTGTDGFFLAMWRRA